MYHALCGLLFLLLLINHSFAAAEPIRIGISLGLTGSYARTSAKQKNAYMMFQEDINTKGGVLGRPIEFVLLDNGSDSQQAASQYEKLIVEEKVDFVIGPYSSKLTLAIAPVVERHGHPTLAAGGAADAIWEQGYTSIFGMWTPASRYVLGFLKLLTYHEINDIVIITADSAFGKAMAEGTRKWAKVLRLDVKGYFEFRDGTKDLTEVARMARDARPSVVICTGHYYVGAALKKAFGEIGWHPPVFYATVSPTFQDYHEEFGKEAELDLSTAIWEPHPKLRYPGSFEFASRYQEKYKETPPYQAATAYAAGSLLVKAITEAGRVDRSKVKEVLRKLNTTTLIGRYAVDKTGLQVKRFPLIVQWQNGAKEIVWPLELQTAPAKFRQAP